MTTTGRDPGRALWLGLAFMVTGHMTVDFYAGMLAPAMPVLAARFGLSLASSGLVLSVASVTSSFAQPVVGYVVDRAGSRPWALYASLSLAALFTGLVGVAPHYLLLIAAAVVAGLGVAVYHPLGAVALRSFTRERLGLAMSLYSAAGTLGYAAAPLVALPLTTRYGPAALLPLSLPGLALAALYVCTRSHWSRGSSWQRSLTGPEPGGARPRLDWRPLLVLNAVNGLRAWAHMAVVAYMAFYLQGRGWPDVYVGVAVSLHVLAGALGGMAGGAVSDRVGRRAVYTVSLVLAAALTIGIHLTSGAPMWVCLALAGAAAQATFPVAVVLAQELMPTRAGLASGMTMGLAFGLGGLGLPLSGYMGDRFGLGAVFYTSALLLLVAAVLSRRLGESRSRPAERTAAV